MMGDQMCEMVLVIMFPSQLFVELNELEHNGDNQEDEQYHVQRRFARFLPMIFFHMYQTSSYGQVVLLCKSMQSF
jgi:hypothetical protein